MITSDFGFPSWHLGVSNNIIVTHNMSYDQYKSVIARKISACSQSVLETFCQDVVMRIIPFVNRADKSNLWPRELKLINSLADIVCHQHLDWKHAIDALDELTKIAAQDDVHVIEIDRDLVEFLSASDNWRELSMNGNVGAAASVSENIMNILDFHYVMETPLDQWLSVPQLREELVTQVKFLENWA